MKTFIKTIAILIFSILLLAGCGYSEEEKALMAQYEKTGNVNAVKYIETKYGFTPEIEKTTILKVPSGPVPDFAPPPTGDVIVNMKYKDREFRVKITGKDISTDGSDDYQKSEITDAFKNLVMKELGINVASIDVIYFDDCLIKERFTGLDAFLLDIKDNYDVSIIVKTCDDIKEELMYLFDYNPVELLVLSCKDSNGIEELSKIDYLKSFKYHQNFSNAEALDNKLFEYSIFMKGYVFRKNNGEIYSRHYELIKATDEVYFVCDSKEGRAGASIRETNSMAPAEDWKRDSGKVTTLPTFENPQKVSKSYEVNFGGLSKMQIFVVKEPKKPQDNKYRYFAMQYMDGDNEVYTHKASVDVSDYYSVAMEPLDNLKIAVMINK